jgi:hypothetical protein
MTNENTEHSEEENSNTASNILYVHCPQCGFANIVSKAMREYIELKKGEFYRMDFNSLVFDKTLFLTDDRG